MAGRRTHPCWSLEWPPSAPDNDIDPCWTIPLPLPPGGILPAAPCSTGVLRLILDMTEHSGDKAGTTPSNSRVSSVFQDLHFLHSTAGSMPTLQCAVCALSQGTKESQIILLSAKWFPEWNQPFISWGAGVLTV